MKHKQNGFGAIEILIVIVVVGLVAGAGWYVLSRNSANDKAQGANTNTQEEVNPSDEVQPASEPEPDAKDLKTVGFYEIEAWGIKIALRDYDKVQFEVKNDGYADPSFRAEFLQDKSCDPGAGLFRTKTKYSDGNGPIQTKVGEFYYHIEGAPGACSSDPENNPDDKLKSRFLDDFTKLDITPLTL